MSLSQFRVSVFYFNLQMKQHLLTSRTKGGILSPHSLPHKHTPQKCQLLNGNKPSKENEQTENGLELFFFLPLTRQINYSHIMTPQNPYTYEIHLASACAYK